MRKVLICLVMLPFLISWDCRPAAAPVTVSNAPVSINDRPTTNQPLPPTKPIAEMSWTTGDDKVQKLADLKGKAVILDFWATYCPPCKAEIPHLNSLIAKYGADNLAIIGLNVGGADDRPEIPAFLAETKMDYPLAFPEAELTNFIFAQRDDIPQTAVFDRNGKMITKIIGFNARLQKELDEAVEQALKTGL